MGLHDAARIAVLLPCYNEEATIVETVRGFQRSLPHASIYVYDNNSADNTARVAAAAGAIVRHESMPGKVSVVRRMFADIDADVYVLADGDATYDPATAPVLVESVLRDRVDMVVGCRSAQASTAYRSGHQFGNWALTRLLTIFFGRSFTDILSGYRAFSKRFVKTFPAFSSGFEIETELSVFALRMRLPTKEVSTKYFDRPEGSTSKLSTYRDGFRIAATILNLTRQERPLLFFSAVGLILAVASIGLAVPIALTFIQTGLVPRFPTAILSASLMLLGFLFAFTGLILDTVVRGRREVMRMHYLLYNAPSAER